MSFKINRVYTRSGDKGETGLVGGTRVKKNNIRVEAYGDIDELNSLLGLLKEELPDELVLLYKVIEYLQQELFDLGSQLATPEDSYYPGMWQVTAEHVNNLEKLCDYFGDGLPELSSFILPGGSKTAALLHLARTTTRRAERRVISLQDSLATTLGLSEQLICYLNRLSDLFFIFARWSMVVEGKEAPLWVQEKERKLPVDFNTSLFDSGTSNPGAMGKN